MPQYAESNIEKQTEPRNKQEERSTRSRQKLLEAAVHIIQTRGMSSLSVRTICAEAGLSTGAFYHLFNSKEDVVNYYLIYAYNRYKEDAPADFDALTATDKIRSVYRYFIEMCEETGYEFMRAYYTPSNSMLNFRNRPNHERVVLEECRDFLVQGQERGEIRPDIDLDDAILEIAMIITGVMFYWCVFEGDLDAKAIFDRRVTAYLKTIEA